MDPTPDLVRCPPAMVVLLVLRSMNEASTYHLVRVFLSMTLFICFLPISFAQNLSGTFEAQAKHMSELRGTSAKPLEFGTAVLSDCHANEESQRATSSLIQGVPPSLQARRVVTWNIGWTPGGIR